ncbi:proton-conducting transporter membrane subunit [uncultured Alistipes sp.]|uniref:proton-conducting transporter transmembrane domain-containing protein n=1 Tax=uncultured Alistipes sp. TaxID=538949 RepID=UPI00258AADCD|nr:proton-conducting transporter membrane subunit [uncultured Alistipes sp.]
MFFLYSLLALGVVAAAVFAAPLRSKVWTALALTAVGALWCSAHAVGVLAGTAHELLWSIPGTIFGGDTGSMDSLSALFVLIISVGAVSAVLYSRGYLEHYLRSKSPAHISLHYTALVVMFYAMLGVVLSDGGFSFLFFWELMTVASFLLILFDAQRREVRRAALSYLIMMHIGFVLLIVGFVRLDAVCGAASFSALGEYFRTEPALPLLIVFLLGFGMKAGLFPMHVWLPEAHPAAPSHVSALMSGVMIKTGIYGLLRVTAALGEQPALHTAGVILLTVGIVTGVWGVILAVLQNDVKRLLAYSSIENVGIILIGLGIAALGKSSGNQLVALCGIAGALLHTLNHSLFKTLLFFGAGNLLSQTRTTSLDALGGVAKHMPLTAILFLTGTVAICALPPLNGFISELLIYLGMLDGIASGSNVLASAAGLAALALIGGLVVMAFTKLYGTVFLGSPRTHEVAESTEADNFRIDAMALPLAGILFVGLFPRAAVSAVTRAAGFFLRTPADAADWLLSPTLSAVGRTAWLLIAVVCLLLWLRRRTLRTRTVAKGPTWGCGFTAPNVRMQYTGESFSEGLQSIATSLTQNSGEGSPVGKGEIFPAAHTFDIGHRDRIGKLFSAWWVELLRMINQRVMRLRTGKINHYILFALAFLGLVFLLSVFNMI